MSAFNQPTGQASYPLQPTAEGPQVPRGLDVAGPGHTPIPQHAHGYAPNTQHDSSKPIAAGGTYTGGGIASSGLAERREGHDQHREGLTGHREGYDQPREGFREPGIGNTHPGLNEPREHIGQQHHKGPLASHAPVTSGGGENFIGIPTTTLDVSSPDPKTIVVSGGGVGYTMTTAYENKREVITIRRTGPNQGQSTIGGANYGHQTTGTGGNIGHQAGTGLDLGHQTGTGGQIGHQAGTGLELGHQDGTGTNYGHQTTGTGVDTGTNYGHQTTGTGTNLGHQTTGTGTGTNYGHQTTGTGTNLGHQTIGTGTTHGHQTATGGYDSQHTTTGGTYGGQSNVTGAHPNTHIPSSQTGHGIAEPALMTAETDDDNDPVVAQVEPHQLRSTKISFKGGPQIKLKDWLGGRGTHIHTFAEGDQKFEWRKSFKGLHHQLELFTNDQPDNRLAWAEKISTTEETFKQHEPGRPPLPAHPGTARLTLTERALPLIDTVVVSFLLVDRETRNDPLHA